MKRSTLILIGLSLFSSVASAADWPQFRGPDRDGVSAETGLLESWPTDGPKPLWRVPLGEGYSGLSVVAGRVYTMFAGESDEFVGSFDGATGKELWRVRVDEKWLDRFGNGPRSTPTVEAGAVYALSGRGELVALQAADGKILWRKDLEKAYGAKPPTWGVSTSPLIEGDLLLVDVGGKGTSSIVAFDKKTGEEAWKSQEDKAGYSAPLAITVGGLRQVLFFSGTKIAAVSPVDGRGLWSQPWKTSYDVNAATPVFVPPDKVFVSSGYDVGGALFQIAVSDGKASATEVWRNREMKNKFSSSILVGGHLYGFDEKTLKCVDVATGQTKWKTRGLGHGSLTYADGGFVALGDEGTLVLFEAVDTGYNEKGRMTLFGGKTWTVPTISDGRLYARDEKELVSLKLTSE